MPSILAAAWGRSARAVLCAVPILIFGAGDPATGFTAGLRHEGARVEREAWAMGTRVRIVVEAERRDEARATTEAALREIERVERVLSTWDAGSELERFNAAPAGEPRAVTAELAGLLGEAALWAERTGRAFDPTVGALIDAWDVRGEGRVPTTDELRAARASVGPGAFTLEGTRATRGSEFSWVDSGGFGKGAALRSIAELPELYVSGRLLVDLGGQLWADAPPEAPWLVDVAHPRDRAHPAARLAVHQASVATSGASERPGHLLDPRSGRPAPDWGSVTVVAHDALAADALSTALYVMGPEAGLEWASARAVAALFLESTPESTPEGLRARWSEAMDAWLVDVSADAGRLGERHLSSH